MDFNIFDWNTKQIYVYIQADYSTTERKTNQVVLFDYVIHEGTVLNGSNILAEYPLEDVNRGLKSNRVTLSLGFDVMPYIGNVGKFSHLQTIGEYQVRLPDDYVPLKRTKGFVGPQVGQR